jgi:hypothetical protein
MGLDFAFCNNTTENMTKFLSHSNASYFLYGAIYNFDMWKFYKTSLQHCWKQLFVNLAPTFVGSVLPTFQKSKYPHQFKVALPSLQRVTHGVLQSLEFGIMFSSQAIF